MKNIFVIVLLTTSIFAIDWNQWDDKDKPFIQQRDNQSHIAINTAISGLATYYAKEYGMSSEMAFITGLVTGVAFGYAKEKWIDKNYSTSDMQSWTIGAVVGSVGVTIWRF
jgi:uncharacterized membrane protein YcjF (UPF0283 family)